MSGRFGGAEPTRSHAVPIAAIVASILAIAVSNSCGSRCGLSLAQRLYFPTANAREGTGEVPCCGASTYQDLNLSADNVQVDLINSSGSDGRVDAFLTSADCVKLFNGPYAGAVAVPLCNIYLGPVTAGSMSGRQAIRRGKYRIFAQAYASNDAPAQFLMELGLWSDACRWNPIAP
jgi:hypothetical protein